MDDWVEEASIAAAEEVIGALGSGQEILLDDFLVAFLVDLFLEEDQKIMVVALVGKVLIKDCRVLEVGNDVLVKGYRRALVGRIDVVSMLDFLGTRAEGVDSEEVMDDVV